MLVAPPAVAPAGEQDALARAQEIGKALSAVRVRDDRSQGKRHDDVLSPRTMPVGSLAMLSPTRPEHVLVAQMIESVQRGVGEGPDRAAIAAVSSRRAAAR